MYFLICCSDSAWDTIAKASSPEEARRDFYNEHNNEIEIQTDYVWVESVHVLTQPMFDNYTSDNFFLCTPEEVRGYLAQKKITW